MLHPPNFSHENLTQGHLKCAIQASHIIRESFCNGTRKNIEVLQQLCHTGEFLRLLDHQGIRSVAASHFYESRAGIRRAGSCPVSHDGGAVYIETACMMLHVTEEFEAYVTTETGQRIRRTPTVPAPGFENSQLVMYAPDAELFIPGSKMNLAWLLHACAFWKHHLTAIISLGHCYQSLSSTQTIRCWDQVLTPLDAAKEIGTSFLACFSVGVAVGANQLVDSFQDREYGAFRTLTFVYSKKTDSTQWADLLEGVIRIRGELDMDRVLWVEVTGYKFEAFGWLLPVTASSHIPGWQRLIFVSIDRINGIVSPVGLVCGHEAIVMPGGKLAFGRYRDDRWAKPYGPFMMWNVD